MVELGTLANVAEVVGGAAVLTGLAYAVWEIRRYREQQRREAGMRWLETFQSEAWARSVRRVWRLPDDADPAVIAEDPGREAAVNHFVTVMNIWGFLVHDGIVPEDLASRAAAADVMPVAWRKLRRWVRAVEEVGGTQPFRWFMWWVDHLADAEPGRRPDPDALWRRLDARDGAS